MAKRNSGGVMVKNNGDPARGWGGKREGSGRKKKDISYCEEKDPHSLYCTAGELAYLRAILTSLREFRALLAVEPIPGHDEAYPGSYEEWEKEYNRARAIDLQEVADHLT